MIRESLTTWRSVTEQLVLLLDERAEEKRDDVIEQMNALLDQREILQSSIQEPFTPEEKVFGQELLPLERILQAKLKVFTKDIRLDISEQQKKKVSIHAYMDPYSQVFRDGTFYDKKK